MITVPSGGTVTLAPVTAPTASSAGAVMAEATVPVLPVMLQAPV